MSWASQFNDSLSEKGRAKFEENAVDILLDCHGMRVPWRKRLLHLHRKGDRTWALTLDDFHETFPSFPVRLFVSSSWSVVAQHPVSRLFGKFPSLPLCREFDELRYSFEQFPSLGMVIKWPFFNGALVLHDHPAGTLAGTRMQFSLPDETKPLTLQPLQDFLHELAWRPSPSEAEQQEHE